MKADIRKEELTSREVTRMLNFQDFCQKLRYKFGDSDYRETLLDNEKVAIYMDELSVIEAAIEHIYEIF